MERQPTPDSIPNGWDGWDGWDGIKEGLRIMGQAESQPQDEEVGVGWDEVEAEATPERWPHERAAVAITLAGARAVLAALEKLS